MAASWWCFWIIWSEGGNFCSAYDSISARVSQGMRRAHHTASVLEKVQPLMEQTSSSGVATKATEPFSGRLTQRIIQWHSRSSAYVHVRSLGPVRNKTRTYTHRVPQTFCRLVALGQLPGVAKLLQNYGGKQLAFRYHCMQDSGRECQNMQPCNPGIQHTTAQRETQLSKRVVLTGQNLSHPCKSLLSDLRIFSSNYWCERLRRQTTE